MSESNNPLVDYTRVKRNEAGEWYALGYSDNGEIIVTSEGFVNEAHARVVAAELGPLREDDE